MNTVKILHQCGHNSVWNFDIYKEDNIGDGFILSPRNMTKNKVESLNKAIKSKSIFDPQFYFPKSSHKNLNSYDFFPNALCEDSYSADFEEKSFEAARGCIEFQVNNNFNKIIIPICDSEQISSYPFDAIENNFYIPHLNALDILGNNNKEVYITFIIKEAHLQKTTFSDTLNFLTKFNYVDGIYLIPDIKRTLKRIEDIDFLFNLMILIKRLKENQLKVLLGYTDIEGFLLSVSGMDYLTIGSYENLRKHGDRYSDVPGPPNPPTPRVYSNILLQWIDYRYQDALVTEFTDTDLFEKTKYRIEMFKPEFKWNFQNPVLYKHYFTSYSRQINSLPSDSTDRFRFVEETIKNAIRVYEKIENSGIMLEKNSTGNHLPYWLTALNRFKKL